MCVKKFEINCRLDRKTADRSTRCGPLPPVFSFSCSWTLEKKIINYFANLHGWTGLCRVVSYAAKKKHKILERKFMCTSTKNTIQKLEPRRLSTLELDTSIK